MGNKPNQSCWCRHLTLLLVKLLSDFDSRFFAKSLFFVLQLKLQLVEFTRP